MSYSKDPARIAQRAGAEPQEYQLEQISEKMIEGLAAPQYAAMYKLFEVGTCSQNQQVV